jgi:S-DNA-T family DNA segregation ATPase FtsK/SpoIIIE
VLGSPSVTLDPDLPVGGSGLHSGATVTLSTPGAAFQDGNVDAAAVVRVISGPDMGKEFRLPRGASVIGRETSCEVRLTDPLVSRQHARINISDAAEVVDLGSANGVMIRDGVTARGIVGAEDWIRVGDTELVIRLLHSTGAGPIADAAAVGFVRPPRLDPKYVGEIMSAPEPPSRQNRQRIPIIPLIAPILMGGILFLITQNTTSIAFVALSPVMMLGNVVESRIAGKRAFEKAVEVFRADINDLRAEASANAAAEVAVRRRENPSVAECIDAAHSGSSLMWARRPGDASFAEVRLGLGRQLSRSSIELPNAGQAPRELFRELREAVAPFQYVEGVPVLGQLRELGAIGVAGPRDTLLGVARGLVIQIAALHSPAEMVIVGFAASQTSHDWDWLKWLPHTFSPHSPLSVAPLAATSTGAVRLISELEDILANRQAEQNSSTLPAIFVLVENDTPLEHSRLVALAESGYQHDIHVLWLAPSTSLLPAPCRTFIDVTTGSASGAVGFVHIGEQVNPNVAETVDAEAALGLARRLAPMVDSGARIDDDTDLPRSVSLLNLTGKTLASDASAVIERWNQNRSIVTGPYAPVPAPRVAGTLRAVIGQSAAGEPHALDLRADGPHALVGGTTGSGKSELLQSWILSMAAAHSPQRLTFLLIDYKGEAAFRDCKDLPHTVGLVTDLSPHLVRRALTSLSAELKYREHLLGTHRAKDLVTLERQGIVEAPPSLVIVVDEFAALVQEMPEFVDGVVNVAQRGRSLGLHLILATQRPAGVIKDNLRANTNLRIALRTADESDSTDVLGSPQAALFDPDLPGRSVSKTGPGRLVPFQSGYVGGWTREEEPPPQILVEELAFGAATKWEAPEVEVAAVDPGPTDIRRMVDVMRVAAAGAEIPPPRKPWLPELKSFYDLSDPAQVPTARRDTYLVFGVRDDPDAQEQPVVGFEPDRDGNLAIIGAGGSGKSTFLRTIATAASFTIRGGPCHVYGLDFGGRGLSMLEPLPHVGSIIVGDDSERISRLVRQLREVIDDRASRYVAAQVGSLSDYRAKTGNAEEARIVLLVDGVPAFRQAYDTGEIGGIFETFVGICADGRPFGVHVVMTADRPGAIPTVLGATIQRRIVMRLADDGDYGMAGVPDDVLSLTSPPGRAIDGDSEMQVAVFGASADVMVQSEAVRGLAASMLKAGIPGAPPVERLTDRIELDELPAVVGGGPALGIASTSLEPIGFSSSGTFILTGPPGSGRTAALTTVVKSVQRCTPTSEFYFFGSFRSSVSALPVWRGCALGTEEANALAAECEPRLNQEVVPVVVVIEGLPDFVNSPADQALQSVIKTALRCGHLVVCEGEVTGMLSSYALLQLARSSRSGLALQPERADASVFRADFPRYRRGDFPVGRGALVQKGKADVVQVALADGSEDGASV